MPGDCCAAGFQPGLCPLRVISRCYRIAQLPAAFLGSTDITLLMAVPRCGNGEAQLAFANFALRRRIEPRQPYLTTLFTISGPYRHHSEFGPYAAAIAHTSASNGFGVMTPCEFSILRAAVFMQRHPHLCVTTLLKAVLSRATQMLAGAPLRVLMMPGNGHSTPISRRVPGRTCS